MSASQILIVPKYVTIPTNAALPKIRPAPSVSPVSSGYASSTGNAAEDCALPKGKKRRLDHLTWEEKVQRKKLKNRVAAQTSRDRKKARMEEMENEIQTLTEKTEILQNKCESLQAINDSLLAKNQKLDMEVELLRQQVADLQQNRNATQSSNSKAVGTCAGSGINSNGLTVGTRTTAKEQHDGGTLEDCCPLPTLQDMLLLDEEFDASKLEELAESLLADITADMETSDRKSNETVAETPSGAERLSGPVVGTTAECLESSKHSTGNSCLNTTEVKQTSALKTELQNTLIQTQIANAQLPDINVDSIITSDVDVNMSTCTNDAYDTVYGTYDAKTNSITIVMDDDAVPVNEAVEEIYCDGSKPMFADEDYIKFPSPIASPSQIYLNVDCATDDENDDNDVDADGEDDLNFDGIEKFLRPKRPLITPLAKSPANSLYSATSDHGYESVMGSPEIPSSEHYQTSSTLGDDVEDFAWNSSFTELFPTLI